MTLDCSEAFADALEAKLAAAADYADYGTFRQSGAQVTCFAPSYSDRGHLHFVDGAGGGYAMAASAMKARRLLKAAPQTRSLTASAAISDRGYNEVRPLRRIW